MYHLLPLVLFKDILDKGKITLANGLGPVLRELAFVWDKILDGPSGTRAASLTLVAPLCIAQHVFDETHASAKL